MSASSIPVSLADGGSILQVFGVSPDVAEKVDPDQWLRGPGGTSARSFGGNECLILNGGIKGVLKGECGSCLFWLSLIWSWIL